VLAAHGVTPDVRRDADDRELFVIDATCPLVAKVHHEARRHHDDGHHIVLIGHSDHEEVIGTLGEAPGRISVVEHPADVDHLDIADDEPVAYLTQTTLALDETAEVIAALHARYPALIGPRADDICYATQNRQEAVRAIAPECDLVVVVGSANSSNTNRLAEVARRAGCPAVLVEDAGELDSNDWRGPTHRRHRRRAAPESLVEGVVAALDALGPVTVEERRVVDETIQFRLPAEVR
jgi:4-hydroxy-3-methylbut-2-enyl diphosphate reductase